MPIPHGDTAYNWDVNSAGTCLVLNGTDHLGEIIVLVDTTDFPDTLFQLDVAMLLMGQGSRLLQVHEDFAIQSEQFTLFLENTVVMPGGFTIGQDHFAPGVFLDWNSGSLRQSRNPLEKNVTLLCCHLHIFDFLFWFY